MIKDQTLAQNILDMMDTALECAQLLIGFLEEEDRPAFDKLSAELYELLNSIRGTAPGLQEQENGLKLEEASESVCQSLLRIRVYGDSDARKAAHKIEFELVPLIEEMRCMFYFWGSCYPDRERLEQYYREDMYALNRNRYIEEAERTGVYRYELSIMVMAYDQLDYTRLCVESLYRNLPKGLSYELVFVNHGSTDGTMEYLETMKPDKQLDVAVNGGGSRAVNRILEGKYWVCISNDVVVTPGAIENLYRCIASDEKTAWAVPATPNVSNLQSIALLYTGGEELEAAARKNNVSDPRRWEQRVRLCNPMEITRSSVVQRLQIGSWFFTKTPYSYPDDAKSLLCRRNGYRMYLAKDAFCHHFGSVTIKEKTLPPAQSKEEFKTLFGIEPWSFGYCYELKLLDRLPLERFRTGHVDIAGLNCGLGATPLELKERLKEKYNNTDVCLHNYTSEAEYLEDLKGVSDYAALLETERGLRLPDAGRKYDYIIAGNTALWKQPLPEQLEFLMNLLKSGGYIAYLAVNEERYRELEERFPQMDTADSLLLDGKWAIFTKEPKA